MDTDINAATEGNHGPIEFPSTKWTQIMDAQDPDSSAKALCNLCEHYHKVIIDWFRMRRPQEAEDLAHQFIERWLTREHLPKIERREGFRFRFYLSDSLKYFFLDYIARENAAKRGSGSRGSSLDALHEMGFEVPDDGNSAPDRLDCHLSLFIHEQAMEALRGSTKDPQRFEHFSHFIPFEKTDAKYSETSVQLGLKEGAVRTAICRMRDDYFETFRSEVAQLCLNRREDVDEETQYLLEILPTAIRDQQL